MLKSRWTPEVFCFNSKCLLIFIHLLIIGKILVGLNYCQPYTGTPCRVVASHNVSSDKGTGLVHSAPAHGKEDFLTALAEGISTVLI